MSSPAGTRWFSATNGAIGTLQLRPTPFPPHHHLRAPPPPDNAHSSTAYSRSTLPSPRLVPVAVASPSPFTSREESDPEEEEKEGEPRHRGSRCNVSTARRGFALMAAFPLLFDRIVQSSAAQEDSDEASVIRSEVRKVLSKSKAAGVLRLAFHDAGTFNIKENTGGMNGSVIYELNRPENAGLDRSIKVLDKSKKELDKALAVSWADLIAIAGSEAVSLCGGPTIPVRIGRLDARSPDPPDQLPLESFDATSLKKFFLLMGFSTQELVALSGAHTLGNKGFGNPSVFDNSYYKILLEKSWTSSDGMGSMTGLPSDRALVQDDECLRWIEIYAADQAKFFKDFSLAYVKLVDSGASWR